MLGLKKNLLNEKGQSVLEYIMLMGIVVIFALALLRSTAFRKIFGNESIFFEIVRKNAEHGYRHAYNGRTDTIWDDLQRYQVPHSSYINKENSSHFFYTKKYPHNQ